MIGDFPIGVLLGFIQHIGIASLEIFTCLSDFAGHGLLRHDVVGTVAGRLYQPCRKMPAGDFPEAGRRLIIRQLQVVAFFSEPHLPIEKQTAVIDVVHYDCQSVGFFTRRVVGYDEQHLRGVPVGRQIASDGPAGCGRVRRIKAFGFGSCSVVPDFDREHAAEHLGAEHRNRCGRNGGRRAFVQEVSGRRRNADILHFFGKIPVRGVQLQKVNQRPCAERAARQRDVNFDALVGNRLAVEIGSAFPAGGNRSSSAR